MRLTARIMLISIGVGALLLIAFFLYSRIPGDKEAWSVIAGSLAVLTATIGVWPTLRVLELQEDALRPYPIPAIDTESRYHLAQLRVTNLGASVAYSVSIRWESHPVDESGTEVNRLDFIPVLLPKESVSTMLGRPWVLFKQDAEFTFKGTITYKDSKGKSFSDQFLCSGHEYSKRLLHDKELPKTLRDLQDLPEKLEQITNAILSLRISSNEDHSE